MLTVAEIIARANNIAQCPNYQTIALSLLNAALSDLCQSYDFADARGLFTFNFDQTMTSDFGSGPYLLPVDYLRASGSSGEGQKAFFWTLNGVPYPMVPCDLSEFDMQVQQAGNQSYPWLWATDMSNSSLATSSRYKAAFPLALTSGSATATAPAGLNVAAGDGIAGEGITPGTLVSSYSGTTLTLNQAAAATLTAASVFTGVPNQAFTYPPPSGAYPVTIRYQRMMPPVGDAAKYPWFQNDGYLIEELAGRLMEVTDDTRAAEFLGDGYRAGRAGRRLRMYLDKVDDKTNRPQTVELDRRRFGPRFQSLKNTKVVGW